MIALESRVLMGNEAIARGLVEAGCQFMTSYPGTPSSEILPGVVRFKEELGLPIYVEWSTNEKVALETALASAYSGKRTAVAMKQVGLNVAADPALSSAYIGVVGGLVLVVADDPGPHSSQTEQDTRLFGLFAKLPVLDPSTPQEAKDLAAQAFELSERHQLPVILRPTTRICHAKQSIACGPVAHGYRVARFERDPRRWAATPRARLQLHGQLNQKLAAIEEEFEGWEQNRMALPPGPLPLGVVASGATHAYLADLLASVGLQGRIGVLKLATAFPLPRARVRDFSSRCDRLLVLEEPDTAVETQIRGLDRPVWGRLTGHVPPQGELTPEVVRATLTAAAREAGLAAEERRDLGLAEAVAGLDLPVRRPTLCPGCGHRAVFYALRRSFPDAIFPGDIGCYTLGLNLGGVDTVHDMGASIAMAAGFYHAHAQESDGGAPPIFATIGDGTFFHSGVPALENAVYNGARFVLLILDNEITGMTGMQPTPEFGVTADGHPGKAISLETLVRGCGVDYLTEADPYDLPRFQRTLRDAWEHTRAPEGGVAVVVARYACITRLKGLGPNRERIPVTVNHGPVPRARDDAPALAPEWMPRYQDQISPCVAACPAGNDVERLLALAGEGRMEEAAAVIYEEHPFPATLGRVCPHPCETACNRADYDGAVAVHQLERLAGDAGGASHPAPTQPRGQAVAVVGAGPAGLTAAYHLARLGYAVEVFEAAAETGGMLRWAIPEYRLPGAVLARELETFPALGVSIRTGVRVGEDLPWSELARFDAVCLATGACREATLGIPGEDRDGVWTGLAFLRAVREGRRPEVGRRVAVVGGGNTAIDAARTARRLGAEVTVYYRREPERLRAIPAEVEAARAEGIFFRFRITPTAVAAGRTRPLSLHLREGFGEEEAAVPVPPEGAGSSADLWAEVDSVIVAVGADPALDFAPPRALAPEGSLGVDPWGRTTLPRLFAAGDATNRGTGTVAGAVNAGKRAAMAIHATLRAEPLDEHGLRIADGPGAPAELLHRQGGSPRAGRVQAVPPLEAITLRHFPEVPQAAGRHRPPEEAIWDFAETDSGLSRAAAAPEAGDRCFHCGVCTRCDTCLKVCPSEAISRDGDRYRVDPERCTGCRLCKTECPRSAISMPAVGACVSCGYCTTWFECPALVRRPDGRADIDRRICVDCGLCVQVCPQGAIRTLDADGIGPGGDDR